MLLFERPSCPAAPCLPGLRDLLSPNDSPCRRFLSTQIAKLCPGIAEVSSQNCASHASAGRGTVRQSSGEQRRQGVRLARGRVSEHYRGLCTRICAPAGPGWIVPESRSLDLPGSCSERRRAYSILFYVQLAMVQTRRYPSDIFIVCNSTVRPGHGPNSKISQGYLHRL